MHILVGEDESRLRERLRDRLGKTAYLVEVAADPEGGLYYGQEFPLDLADKRIKPIETLHVCGDRFTQGTNTEC